MNTLNSKIENILKEIKNNGLFKDERILQSQQDSKIHVNDKSVLNCCGYKRTHPLENKILFTMSMNNNDPDIGEDTKKIIQDGAKQLDKLDQTSVDGASDAIDTRTQSTIDPEKKAEYEEFMRKTQKAREKLR